MQFSKSFLFTAVALIAPIAMQATHLTSLNIAPITTADGSLTFSNFKCATTFSGAGSFTGTCAALNIAPLAGPDGIMFQEGLNAAGGDFDMFLSYTVTANTSPISSIGMLFNGSITPQEGSGTASVTEQALWAGTIIPDSQVVVVDQTLGAYGTNSVDSANIPLFAALGVGQSLTVDKDINLTACECSTASLSYVNQTFVDPSPAPEPGTTALMGGGMVLFGLVLRRRFTNKQVAQVA
jgi:PEP-CTERM motif-containing protein